MRNRKWLGWKVCVLVFVAALTTACGGGGDDSGSTVDSAPQSGGSGGGGSSNSKPTISGQPGTSVLVGQSYTFEPAASDADGDTLTFTVTNLPSWASFNAATGEISGTPASADIATYSSITITVSDGTDTASLAPFGITVSDVASGSATLSWTAPTQNTDGSSLTDLSGYQILYGKAADDLSQSVSVDNPSVSVYVLENLTSGTWYFAVMAVNSGGVSSSLSNVASKTIS